MKKKLLFVLFCFASGAWAGERFKTPEFQARRLDVHAFINELRSRNPEISSQDISAKFVARFKLAPGSEHAVLSQLYDAEALVLNFGKFDEKESDRYKHVLAHQAFYLAAALYELSVGA